MRLGRYHQAPTSLALFQNSNKFTPRRTGNSFIKNPELTSESMKLPSLANTMGGRGSTMSLTTERNTKNKLNILSSKLDQVQAQVHNARMDSNELYNHLKFLRQELLENKLKQDHEDMKSQIQGLQKLVKITKMSHENRSNNLREDYISLWNKTEEMKQMVFEIRIRTQKLDETMGMKM